MSYCINTHCFYVEYFEGLKELILQPAATQSIDIIKQDIYEGYCQANMNALSNPNEKVKILLFDNYGRKYTIKTNMGIDAFQDQ